MILTSQPGGGRQPPDFFAAQRWARRRSSIVIGGIFLTVWAVVNFLLIGLHARQACDTTGACTTAFRVNGVVLIVTGVLAAGYLLSATLFVSRRLVAGRHIVPASGPGMAVFRNVVEEMAIASGVPVPACYVLQDRSLNAFAISDGRRNGAVIVTAGLLAALDRRELSGVVAHEIGHIRNRDSRVLIVAVSAVGFVVLVATVATALAVGLAKSIRDAKGNAGILAAGLAMAALLVAAVLRFIALPCTLLLRAALSRRREELADASAVQFTRDPGGLRSALEKIAVGPMPAVVLRPTAAALCIEQPAQADAGLWLGGLMATHPPIEQRIAWLRALEGAGATWQAGATAGTS
jgi:heat shock protein HtpX